MFIDVCVPLTHSTPHTPYRYALIELTSEALATAAAEKFQEL